MSECQDLSVAKVQRQLKNLIDMKWSAFSESWDKMMDPSQLENSLDLVGEEVKNTFLRTMNHVQQKIMQGEVEGADIASIFSFLFTGGEASFHGLTAYILKLYKIELQYRVLIGEIFYSDLLTIRMILNMILNAVFGDHQKDILLELRRATKFIDEAYYHLGFAQNKLKNLGIYDNTSISMASQNLEYAKNALNMPLIDQVREEIADAGRPLEDYIQESIEESLNQEEATDAQSFTDAISQLSWGKDRWTRILNAAIVVNSDGELSLKSLQALKLLTVEILKDFSQYIPYDPAKLFASTLGTSATLEDLWNRVSEQDDSWVQGTPGGLQIHAQDPGNRTLQTLNNTIRQRTQFIPELQNTWSKSEWAVKGTLANLNITFALLQDVRDDMQNSQEEGLVQNATLLAIKESQWKERIDIIQGRLYNFETEFGEQLGNLGEARETLENVIQQITELKHAYGSDVPPASERVANRFNEVFAQVFTAFQSKESYNRFFNTITETLVDTREMIDVDKALIAAINLYIDDVMDVPSIRWANKEINEFFKSIKSPYIRRFVRYIQNGNLAIIVSGLLSTASEIIGTVQKFQDVISLENPVINSALEKATESFSCLKQIFQDKEIPEEFTEQDFQLINHKAEDFQIDKYFINASSEKKQKLIDAIQGIPKTINPETVQSFTTHLQNKQESTPKNNILELIT